MCQPNSNAAPVEGSCGSIINACLQWAPGHRGGAFSALEQCYTWVRTAVVVGLQYVTVAGIMHSRSIPVPRTWYMLVAGTTCYNNSMHLILLCYFVP